MRHEKDGRSVVGTLLDGEVHGLWRVEWPERDGDVEAFFSSGRPVGSWKVRHADGGLDEAMHRYAEPFTGSLSLNGPWSRPELELRGGGLLPHYPGEFGIEVSALADSLSATDEWRETVEKARAAVASGDAELVRPALALASVAPAERVPLLAAVLVDELIARASDDERRESAALFAQALRIVFADSTYGWSAGTTDAELAFDRLAALRWHTLVRLEAPNPSFWELDLRIGFRTGETTVGAALAEAGADVESDLVVELSPGLLSPPFPFPVTREGVATESASAPRKPRRSDSAAADAVDEAVTWLVAHQSEDGSWPASGFCDECGGDGNVLHSLGTTALALEVLGNAGNTISSGPHADAVRRGILWLTDQRDERGALLWKVLVMEEDKRTWYWANDYVHSHVLGTKVLADAARASGSAALTEAAQAAVVFLGLARNPYSGWHYEVPPTGENDAVTTALAVVAVRAAQDAGLELRPGDDEGGVSFLDEVTNVATGHVGYKEFDDASSRTPGVNEHYPRDRTETVTAGAFYARLVHGLFEENVVEAHADLLAKKLPRWDGDGLSNDACYWWWGTEALSRHGGNQWKKWRLALLEAVLDSQRRDGHLRGSWDPNGPWGHAGGRIYSTAAVTLALQAVLRSPG